MADLTPAESAFVNAVAALMRYQDEIMDVQQRLHDLEEKAATANGAALNDSGLTDDSPLTAVSAHQKRLLEVAIQRSGLRDDNPVIRGVRAQLDQMDEVFNKMEAMREQDLARFQGPQN